MNVSEPSVLASLGGPNQGPPWLIMKCLGQMIFDCVAREAIDTARATAGRRARYGVTLSPATALLPSSDVILVCKATDWYVDHPQ
jgi:hypothetical protein